MFDFAAPMPRQAVDRERVLVIAPHSSYRTPAFLNAADKLGIDVLFASEGKHSVVSVYADGLHIDLHDSNGAMEAILEEAKRRPFVGVIGTDDPTTEIAALAAQELRLPHNPLSAVKVARRKDLARALLLEKGIPVPNHHRINLRRPLAPQADNVRFPCVLKPIALSASRGVIRADDRTQFVQSCIRIDRLLQSEEAKERDTILAEDFIPGIEVAVEGMLTGGQLNILAFFDKPDPLDGPYFEETYYVTPSRLNRNTLQRIQQRIAEGCAAYGLREGPIHAECRVNDQDVWILEVAARTIGGLCGQLLSFGTGQSLEELVLAHAMGLPFVSTQEKAEGAGVLMIPTPSAGMLRRVEGVLAAEHVPFIEEVSILVRPGHRLVPWPEGSSYLGFIFARAPTPEQAEAALRQAHACLNFVVAPVWDLNPKTVTTTEAV